MQDYSNIAPAFGHNSFPTRSPAVPVTSRCAATPLASPVVNLSQCRAHPLGAPAARAVEIPRATPPALDQWGEMAHLKRHPSRVRYLLGRTGFVIERAARSVNSLRG